MATDVFFYEAFAEEEQALRACLPETVARVHRQTIQEYGRAAGAALISIRTQSAIRRNGPLDKGDSLAQHGVRSFECISSADRPEPAVATSVVLPPRRVNRRCCNSVVTQVAETNAPVRTFHRDK